MTDLLAALGLPGISLLLGWIAFAGYWATRPFRPTATWTSDLAKACAHLKQQRSRARREPLPMAHDLWPRCEVGPRMWRWPLNTTRHVCAGIWVLIRYWRGPIGLTVRLAWYPATGLGALAALAQAVVLMTVFTVPAALWWFLIDSSTVIRGGLPPSRPSHDRKVQAVLEQRMADTERRLAAIRAATHQQQPAMHR